MPRRVIDTAVVEYLPDFSAFSRTADRELQRAFARVERIAEESAEEVEESFREASTVIETSLDNVALEARQSFETVERVAGEAANEMSSDFRREGEQAERALDEIGDRAQREMAQVTAATSVAASNVGKGFNKAGLAASAAFLGIGAAATAGLGALTFMGLKSAAQLEQLKIGFNALTGSAEEGLAVFQSLQAFAAKTPFEFPEIASAAKRFLAFNDALNISDDSLLDFLTTVGDVVSVVGTGAEGLNRIAFALGQIASKGKLSLEELNQISEAVPGFSAIAAVAAARGTTTAQALEDISAGAISAQEGVQALLKGMREFPGAAGAMEMQSQTLLGVFSTFKDVIGQTLAASFEPAIPAIKQSLKDLTPVIGDAIGDIAPQLGQLLAGVLPLLGSLIKLIAPILGPILAALGDALKTLGPSLEQLGPPLVDIVVALVPLIPLLAELVKLAALILVPTLQLLVPLFQLLAPVIQFVADAVGAFVTWLSSINWANVGRSIGGAFTKAWTATKNFFVGIGRFLGSLPSRVAAGIRVFPEVLVKVIGLAFDRALQLVGAGIGLMMVTIREFPGMVMRELGRLLILMNTFMVNLWNTQFENVRRGVMLVVNFINSIPGRVAAGLAAFPGVVAAIFTKVFNRAKAIVSGTINAIVGFFRNMPKRLASFASDIGRSIVQFIASFLNRAIDAVNSGIAKIDEIVPGSLPRIPRLAHGGIAMGPALIGEDSSTSPEAAIPLGDSRALAMLRDALGTSGTTVTFAPNAIVVNVTGDVSPQRAGQIGRAIGENIANVVTARSIRTAVRVS